MSSADRNRYEAALVRAVRALRIAERILNCAGYDRGAYELSEMRLALEEEAKRSALNKVPMSARRIRLPGEETLPF